MTIDKLIIFGTGDIAELAHFYFTKQTALRPVAFTVDDTYVKEPKFHGLPVVPSSELAKVFPPNEHMAFAAISYAKMNRVREEKFRWLNEQGYNLASFISPKATCLSDQIGKNCFVLEDNTIQPFASIGDNVTLWSGNHIGHHSRIDDHCFLASHIVVSGGVHIGPRCFIGVNATLRDHITVGEGTLIGAGCLILKGTEPFSVYKGEATQPTHLRSSEIKI
jgi:sugar O-acyltransferase (sialic acid O-acetyltransferase NeuD family)